MKATAPVRLRRLEIQGFKSFATRTAFDFGPGITAIVGPNGSGKSNLADALRWALGEQNPRILRLRRLEDAIFAGGGKRAQSGFAEVSITLDNSDGWLPIEFAEVVVTRRLHRSGESEYLINRRRVRLRDLLDLFLKARLGQNSYAILGQGMVDVVLSLKPDERRTLVEEAADVRRHRLKIDEATDQLAATRDNRDRVELLLAEIAPRLAQLERQAHRAAEHSGLARDLADSLSAHYAHRLRLATTLLGRAREQLADADAQLEHSRSCLLDAESRLDQTRAEAVRAAHESDYAETGWRRATEDVREAERRVREARERIPFLARRHEETARDLASLEQEALALEKDAPTGVSSEAALHAADEAIAALADEQRRASERVEEAKVALQLKEEEQRHARQVQLEVDGRVSRLESELLQAGQDDARLRQRRQAVVARLKSWAREYRETIGRLPDLERRVQTATTSLSDATRRARTVAGALTRAEGDLLSLHARLEGERRRLDLLEHEREARRPTEDVIVALLDALRGGGPGRPRVLGILGGLLHVQRGMEIAIEAAMAESLNGLVVRSEREAIAAIGVLREVAAGRLTFYVLEGMRGAHPLNLSTENGVLGVASRFVRCEEAYRDLVESLLGRTVVVEDLEAGRRVVRRGLAAAVTLDGTLLRLGGVVSGGGGKTAGYLFQADADLEELSAAVSGLERELTTEVDKVAGLREQATEAAEREETIEQNLAELLQRAEAAELLLSALRRRLEPLRGELDWIRLAGAEVGAKAEALRLELEAARFRSGGPGDEDSLRLAAALADTESRLRSLLEAQQRISAQLSEAQGHRAAVERERAAQAALQEQSRAARERTAALIVTRRQAIEVSLQERERAEAEAEQRGAELAVRRATSAKLLDLLEPARQGASAVELGQRSLFETVSAARAALTASERLRLDAELAASRAAQELEHLRNEGHTEGFESDLAAAVGGNDDLQPLQPTLEELAERIAGLRARIRALGAVNEEAETDYRESRERHDFLSVQVTDLREAEVSLIEALDQLRQIVRDRFRATFQAINADFQVYFRAFFGGGQARLVLTEPEDYGESGVDIIAQPPGKRLQNLAMLSGGERSMTAVALIFALLESNPAPFCVLDEVDAALDESNVGRFSEALTKLAERGQFLVVTHNRGTVQAADNIYGVSMTADGISNVLSMRLAEATPMLV